MLGASSLPFEGGHGWVLIKVIVEKVCPADKSPYWFAPSPRISNTQLTFCIEILSSPAGRGVLQALIFIWTFVPTRKSIRRGRGSN